MDFRGFLALPQTAGLCGVDLLVTLGNFEPVNVPATRKTCCHKIRNYG